MLANCGVIDEAGRIRRWLGFVYREDCAGDWRQARDRRCHQPPAAYRGAELAIFYRSRTDEAAALAVTLGRNGASAFMLQADVGDRKALVGALDAVLGRFGKVDILVNVAGFAVTGSPEKCRRRVR